MEIIMKKKLLTAFILFFSLNTFAFNQRAYFWGEEVDVVSTGTVEFRLQTELSPDSIEIHIDEYGGFECLVDITKRGHNLLSIYVDWYPGSDSSGCQISLVTNDGRSLGDSLLFMSY